MTHQATTFIPVQAAKLNVVQPAMHRMSDVLVPKAQKTSAWTDCWFYKPIAGKCAAASRCKK